MHHFNSIREGALRRSSLADPGAGTGRGTWVEIARPTFRRPGTLPGERPHSAKNGTPRVCQQYRKAALQPRLLTAAVTHRPAHVKRIAVQTRSPSSPPLLLSVVLNSRISRVNSRPPSGTSHSALSESSTESCGLGSDLRLRDISRWEGGGGKLGFRGVPRSQVFPII